MRAGVVLDVLIDLLSGALWSNCCAIRLVMRNGHIDLVSAQHSSQCAEIKLVRILLSDAHRPIC